MANGCGLPRWGWRLVGKILLQFPLLLLVLVKEGERGLERGREGWRRGGEEGKEKGKERGRGRERAITGMNQVQYMYSRYNEAIQR